MSKHVTISGPTPYSDLIKRYCNSDLFVFPSVWKEPFGMPVAEAMACGTPVVATRSGGITEIIEHGKTGFLVERGDPSSLADAILLLLEDQNLRKSMGKAGRQRAVELFTWDRIAQVLVSCYRQILID
jgi:glycosyltransferase involved in cell wall biosynthesis